MSFHYRKEVISPEVLSSGIVLLTPEQKAQKEIRDAQIRAIITGESDKFLLIIGPCSADHEDSVCEILPALQKCRKSRRKNSDCSTNLYKQTKNYRRGLQRNRSPA